MRRGIGRSGAAVAWLALAGPAACATATGSGDAAPRSDAAGQPDAARIGVDDGGRRHPDAGRTDGGPGGAPLLNEFVANHTGTDQCELVEVIGRPDTDYSEYAVVVVEGDVGANPGSVDIAIPVGTTGAGGLWVSAPLGEQIENGSATLLLVAGFAGGTIDLDTDDDGTFDQEPWNQLADAVAVSDGGAGDLLYAGGALLEPSFDRVGIAVGGASRIPDGTDTDQPADWVRNDFDGDGLTCGTGGASSGEALNTPGMPNEVQP